MSEINPYAAPAPGGESSTTSAFVLSDELRKQIVAVARLMLVAGGLGLFGGVLSFINEGFTIEGMITSSFTSVIPLFVAFAGHSLLDLSRNHGNDLPTLIRSFRQMQVAFIVKGGLLVLFIAVGLLALVYGFGSAAL